MLFYNNCKTIMHAFETFNQKIEQTIMPLTMENICLILSDIYSVIFYCSFAAF